MALLIWSETMDVDVGGVPYAAAHAQFALALSMAVTLAMLLVDHLRVLRVLRALAVVRAFVVTVVVLWVRVPMICAAFFAIEMLDAVRAFPFVDAVAQLSGRLLLLFGFVGLVSAITSTPYSELIPFTPAELVTIGGLWVVGMTASFLLQTAEKHQATILQLDDAVRRLTGTNTAFHELASTAEHRSRIQERNRITRELHDALGYLHTNMMMLAEAALRDTRQEDLEIRERLVAVRDQARTALTETRSALRDLRNTKDPEDGGFWSIYRLVRTFEKATGIAVTFETGVTSWSESTQWPSITNEVLYRIVQEAMINSFRHGRATKVEVHIERRGSTAVLSIRDNGRGSTVVKHGIGLSGMRERVAELGGEIEFSSSLGGFWILAQLPIGETE